MTPIRANITGRFRFETVSPDGSSQPKVSDWVNNMVVDSGLDMLFTASTALGSTEDIAASGYGFLVPMAFCRLSEFHRDPNPTLPSDPLGWKLYLQGASSGRYTKTFPEITHVNYPDTVNSVSYGSDSNFIWATFQRTYVFPPSGVSKNWVECGVSNSASQVDVLFNRINLPATLTVLGTEELRVIYQLKVAIPKNSVLVNLSNGGFDASGTLKIVGSPSSIFGGILANGVQEGGFLNSMPHILRGNGNPSGYLLTNDSHPADLQAILAYYSGSSKGDSTTTSVTKSNYIQGSFERDFTLTWGLNKPESIESDIHGSLMSDVNSNSGVHWLFSTNQVKDPVKSLSQTITVAWARPS